MQEATVCILKIEEMPCGKEASNQKQEIDSQLYTFPRMPTTAKSLSFLYFPKKQTYVSKTVLKSPCKL